MYYIPMISGPKPFPPIAIAARTRPMWSCVTRNVAGLTGWGVINWQRVAERRRWSGGGKKTNLVGKGSLVGVAAGDLKGLWLVEWESESHPRTPRWGCSTNKLADNYLLETRAGFPKKTSSVFMSGNTGRRQCACVRTAYVMSTYVHG